MIVFIYCHYLCRLFRINLHSKCNLNMIKVSDIAKKKVIELMTDDGYDPSNDFVRIGVKSGGCSGLSYDLNFDKIKTEEDKVFEDNGVHLIVDKKSFLYLVGTTLEYSGGLNTNPVPFKPPEYSSVVPTK